MTDEIGLRISGFLLGGFLFAVFGSYMILTFAETKPRKGVGNHRRFAGTVSLVVGSVMLCAWFYFLFTGWASFSSQAAEYGFHVAVELGAAIALIVAGVGMVRNWARGPALYMIANGILIFTSFLPLAVYRGNGHPVLMNGISILMVIVAVYLVAIVYGWMHFVCHLDEPGYREKRK